MSISSIVQIAERLLSGNIGKEPQAQDKNKSAQTTAQTQANRTEFGDRFTPSERADTANGAGGTGLLQVEQLRFTVVNIQTPTGDAATTNVAAPAVAAVPANTGLTAAAAAPVAVVPTVAVTAATQPATAPATTTATQTQQDLQTLNSALASLGLNAAEIAAFDQYAGILLQFDPNALQDLENQLNLLAAQYQTQNAPAPAATTPAATTTAATTGAATTTVAPAATPSPGFQLNELSITFTGVKETVTQGAAGSGNATTTQISAFSLQVQEVRVSLTNPAGQTTQLQVPQASKTTAAATPPPATKTATA